MKCKSPSDFELHVTDTNVTMTMRANENVLICTRALRSTTASPENYFWLVYETMQHQKCEEIVQSPKYNRKR